MPKFLIPKHHDLMVHLNLTLLCGHFSLGTQGGVLFQQVLEASNPTSHRVLRHYWQVARSSLIFWREGRSEMTSELTCKALAFPHPPSSVPSLPSLCPPLFFLVSFHPFFNLSLWTVFFFFSLPKALTDYLWEVILSGHYNSNKKKPTSYI